MAKAIEEGIPKLRIEEAAARTQARIDSGAQAVIGVNTYRLDDSADVEPLEVLKIDNDEVYRQQVAKLERLRAERDDDEVRRAARRSHEGRRTGEWQSAGRRRRRGTGQGDGRRDQ